MPGRTLRLTPTFPARRARGESPADGTAFDAERRRRLLRLAALDAGLAGGADTAGLRFERARLLDALGDAQAARDAYLGLLRTDSTHAGALNELGRLLERTGFPAAARSAFERAVAFHPDDPVGHGNLAGSLLDAGDVTAARQHYAAVLRLDPDHPVAHACSAVIALREGDAAAAAAHARIGFRAGATAWPYRGAKRPRPVLVVRSALGGNIPIERFLDDRIFAKWTLVAEFAAYSERPRRLPPHCAVINAIGDADRCAQGLADAAALLAGTAAPVVNAPERVLATARGRNAARLAAVPGIIAPRTAVHARAELLDPEAPARLAAAGMDWPLIVRAPGFHTGLHCALVERPAELADAVAALPGDSLLTIAFVDLRGADGAVRKYRAMIVDGELFALHLAISRSWKVHYFSADMTDRPEHRAEEAAFLADMRGVLGPRAMSALETVAATLGLDYGGIDFGIDRAGLPVIFEANATMIVPPPPTDPRWAYRREAVERIEAAVGRLLLARTTTADERRMPFD